MLKAIIALANCVHVTSIISFTTHYFENLVINVLTEMFKLPKRRTILSKQFDVQFIDISGGSCNVKLYRVKSPVKVSTTVTLLDISRTI